MPRCYSCGQFVKKPHMEIDGRVEKAFCDLCYAERDWKFGENSEPLRVPAPELTWWNKIKRFFGG